MKVEGPFGAAFFRPQAGKRVILVAGGTGFAPIYAIAGAALAGDSGREIVVLAAARTLDGLYMIKALAALNHHSNVTVMIVVRDAPEGVDFIRRGDPIAQLPVLEASDVIYAAGSPAMVRGIAAKADVAGAVVYCDPFEQSGTGARTRTGFVDRMVSSVRRMVAG